MSVALIGALLAGGYMLTRGNGDDPVESANERFARLAARPLELPRNPDASGGCQLGVAAVELPGVPTEGGLGPLADREDRVLAVLRKGPVYAVPLGGPPRLMDLYPAPGGPWAKGETLWVSKPSYSGPVLVRGGRLDGRSRIRFGAGPDPRLELRLGAGEWDDPGTARLGRDPLRLRRGWRVAVTAPRVKTSGCYAFQVDGEGFGYVLAFAAVVQGGQ